MATQKVNPKLLEMANAEVSAYMARRFGRDVGEPIPQGILNFIHGTSSSPSDELMKSATESYVKRLNMNAKLFRENTRADRFPTHAQVAKASGALAKANLDVGTISNLSQVTGGQSLGYVSLDTQMARGTVRPNSFTLYNSLEKSSAYQVVDYWPYASATGGKEPGGAFGSYSSVPRVARLQGADAHLPRLDERAAGKAAMTTAWMTGRRR